MHQALPGDVTVCPLLEISTPRTPSLTFTKALPRLLVINTVDVAKLTASHRNGRTGACTSLPAPHARDANIVRWLRQRQCA